MNAIHTFWEFFVKNCATLHNPPDRAAMDDLLKLLGRIDPKLYYHLGSHNDGTDLILSAEGHPHLMLVLHSIESASPKIEGWKTVVCYSGLALFGERDLTIFPDDVNGEALYLRYRAGDQLWRSRPVDFAVIFPNEENAVLFREMLPMRMVREELDEYRGVDGYTHQIELSIDLIPTYANITAMEQELAGLAGPLGGRNDGWGSWQITEDPDTK